MTASIEQAESSEEYKREDGRLRAQEYYTNANIFPGAPERTAPLARKQCADVAQNLHRPMLLNRKIAARRHKISLRPA